MLLQVGDIMSTMTNVGAMTNIGTNIAMSTMTNIGTNILRPAPLLANPFWMRPRSMVIWGTAHTLNRNREAGVVCMR